MRKLTFALSLLIAFALVASTHHLAAEPQTLSVELVSTFDYPQTAYSLVQTGEINDQGQFVGTVMKDSVFFGFSGSAAGALSRPFSEPRDSGGYTNARGINNVGTICGFYDDDDLALGRGFLRRGRTYRAYDAPVSGLQTTVIESVNDAGDFVGTYSTFSGRQAYAHIGGTFSTIPGPGLYPDLTGINNLDQVVGSYQDDTLKYDGFFRAADGTLTFPLSYPGSLDTYPAAINDSGFIVGFWASPHGAHAFVLQLPDTFVTFDVPDASSTYFSGINSAGLICGTYMDKQGRTHGLSAQLQGQ